MKHKGASVDYSEQRDDELMRAFDTYMEQCAPNEQHLVYERIVDMPCSRFWVSDKRASVVVCKMIRGEEDLSKAIQTKREMFIEIYNRVMKLKEENPKETIISLCAKVVMQPAPRFYLTAGTAIVLVSRARKRWNKKMCQRLQRYF